MKKEYKINTGNHLQNSKKNKQILSRDHEKVYILLIRTNSLFSRLVHMVTKANYTHASIGMGADCEEMYSFARRYTALPLPAGFVGESVNQGLMAKSPDAPCALYELKISRDSYMEIREQIRFMSERREQLQYSCLGTVFCFFHLAYERENRYFCSQFVASVLEKSGALKLYKPASLYHPNDFTKIKELRLCYQGTLGGLKYHRNAVAV